MDAAGWKFNRRNIMGAGDLWKLETG